MVGHGSLPPGKKGQSDPSAGAAGWVNATLGTLGVPLCQTSMHAAPFNP